MYQHTSSFVVVMNVGRVGYLKEVPVSLVQSSGCGVGGVSVRGGCVGVSVGVAVGVAVGGVRVSPPYGNAHVIRKPVSIVPSPSKKMYTSWPSFGSVTFEPSNPDRYLSAE